MIGSTSLPMSYHGVWLLNTLESSMMSTTQELIKNHLRAAMPGDVLQPNTDVESPPAVTCPVQQPNHV